MSADRVRSGARAGLPGVGTLDAAGGPAAWCRSAVRATRRVADLDARLDAVCVRAPRTPTLVRGPVLGHALDDCLRRLDRGEAAGVESPDGTGAGGRDGSGTGQGDRARRRSSGTGGDGRSRDDDATGVTVPRARPFGRVGPASALARRPGLSTAASGESEQHGPHGAAGARRVAVSGTDAGAGLTADRLRALAGPVPTRVLAGPTAPVEPAVVDRARRRGPGAVRRPVERRATDAGPSAPAVAGAEHAAVVAARVLRRIAGRPGSAAVLARSVVRPDARPADQALVDVLVRWSAWRGLAAEAADDGSSDARGGTPATSGARRRRGRGRSESTEPDGDRVGATGGPELAGARRPSTPAVDEHPVRSPSRFAEQPSRPRRLIDLVDPPADEDAAGDAGPGNDGVGLRPGLARVAVDTSAATGVGGTVPTVSAPELERVLARVLRDAASRHGIEV